MVALRPRKVCLLSHYSAEWYMNMKLLSFGSDNLLCRMQGRRERRPPPNPIELLREGQDEDEEDNVRSNRSPCDHSRHRCLCKCSHQRQRQCDRAGPGQLAAGLDARGE